MLVAKAVGPVPISMTTDPQSAILELVPLVHQGGCGLMRVLRQKQDMRDEIMRDASKTHVGRSDCYNTLMTLCCS